MDYDNGEMGADGAVSKGTLWEIRKGIVDLRSLMIETISPLEKQVPMLSARLDLLEKELNHILKLVRDGNGKPAILERIQSLESNNLHRAEDEKREHEEMVQSLLEARRIRWQVAIALWASFISVILAVITKLMNLQ